MKHFIVLQGRHLGPRVHQELPRKLPKGTVKPPSPFCGTKKQLATETRTPAVEECERRRDEEDVKETKGTGCAIKAWLKFKSN